MAVGHLPAVLENIAAVGVGKPPPVDLHQPDIVFIQIFFSNVIYRIHVSRMTGDKHKILRPILNELSYQEIQPVL